MSRLTKAIEPTPEHDAPAKPDTSALKGVAKTVKIWESKYPSLTAMTSTAPRDPQPLAPAVLHGTAKAAAFLDRQYPTMREATARAAKEQGAFVMGRGKS